jgi:hypothetical protein
MATKRTPVPGEADKLIAHQSRLLKAPRIAGHYARLAEQGRAAGWSLEDYLAAVLAVESNARAESGARQRIRYAGFPAIKTITDFDFTAHPPSIGPRSPASKVAAGWPKRATSSCSDHPAPARPIWPPPWRSPPLKPVTGSHSHPRPGGSADWPKRTA